MRVAIALAVALLIVTTGISAQTLVPWVLYDNFNAPLINPDKWFGTEDGEGSVGLGTEGGRFIQGGRLRMFKRGYGNTVSNSAQTFGDLQMHFANPDAVTAIKATVAVRAFEIKTCPLNSSATVVRADLSGYFFNTGVPGAPGDSTNDVTAKIRLQRRSDSADATGVLRVIGTAFRCDDVPCFLSTSLGTFDLGTVTTGQAAALAVTWDRGNHRFIYQFGSMTVAGPYTVPDTAPPANPSRRALRLQNSVPNCTAAPRPMGFIDASFDDVYVNRP